MNTVLEYLAPRLFSLLGTIVTPVLGKLIELSSAGFLGKAPQVGTSWVVRFRDVSGPGKTHPGLIDARLNQVGWRISGSGNIQGQPGDPFKYQGLVVRNVLFGTFHRANTHVLAGTGTFVLKISADSKRMSGRCTWYDGTIDNVWSSQYLWLRAG